LGSAPPKSQVSLGIAHTAILCADGRCYTFGANHNRQLGQARKEQRAHSSSFGALEGFAAFCAPVAACAGIARAQLAEGLE
jgi:alpha-tubulin suppressor-like RCC1 family protein